MSGGTAPPDTSALAALHARCFDGAPPPWSGAAIAATLAQGGAFLVGGAEGFLIGRAILDEAELLTVAVAPEARRRGTGRALLLGFETEARARGAITAFLEVAETNAPARALYAAAGWRAAGRRPGYYPGGIAALTLRRDLTDSG